MQKKILPFIGIVLSSVAGALISTYQMKNEVKEQIEEISKSKETESQ